MFPSKLLFLIVILNYVYYYAPEGLAGLEPLVNGMMDSMIAEHVKKDAQKNMPVTDIREKISNGHFRAYNGTFSDLSSLVRSGDAKVTRNGDKFIVNCSFALPIATVFYQRYNAKYLLSSVSGKLTAKIDGLIIATVMEVDYRPNPCKPSLQSAKVTNFGKLKVRLTGMGGLNNLLSKIGTKVAKSFQGEIVNKIETAVKNVVSGHISKFNCAQYKDVTKLLPG